MIIKITVRADRGERLESDVLIMLERQRSRDRRRE